MLLDLIFQPNPSPPSEASFKHQFVGRHTYLASKNHIHTRTSGSWIYENDFFASYLSKAVTSIIVGCIMGCNNVSTVVNCLLLTVNRDLADH